MIALKAEGALTENEALLLHLIKQGDQNMVRHPNEINDNILRFLLKKEGKVRSHLVMRRCDGVYFVIRKSWAWVSTQGD
jgi:hypothetical protein